MATSYGNIKIDKEIPINPLPKPSITIQDEENPIPDKYEGDIIFNKTIYSSFEFRDRVDTSFSELNLTTPKIDIQQFFSLYNELFFDIPKTGENSHNTIIQTSLDYIEDYVNPLQSIIDSKDLEIESLTRQLLAVQSELSTLQIEQEQEEIAEASAEAEYLAVYSDINDPILKFNWLKTNLDTYRPQLDSQRDSYFENINEDLVKAYGIGGSVDVPASQWKNNIEQVGGSTNTKKADLKAMIDATVLNIVTNAYGSPVNAWKL